MRLAEALRELFAEQVLRLKGRHGSLTYRCSTGLDAHFLFLLCLQGAAHGIESRWLCFLLCWGGFVSISEVQRHASGADIEASAGAVFVLNRRLRIRCHVPPICAIGISYAPACCVAKYWRSAKGGGFSSLESYILPKTPRRSRPRDPLPARPPPSIPLNYARDR